jgi:hypothetical protein
MARVQDARDMFTSLMVAVAAFFVLLIARHHWGWGR